MKTIYKGITSGACLLTFGCASLDLDKGTPVAELSLDRPSTQAVQVQLPGGSVDIVLAVRDGKCHPLNPQSRVEVAISAPGFSVERSLKAGDLTWSFAEGSCDAYGYMYDTATGLSKNINLNADQYRFLINVTPASAEQRKATLWVIYGGRAPTVRMFPAGSNR